MARTGPQGPSHPVPWTARAVGDGHVLVDADGEVVETVYGRAGDPTGQALAERIAAAVNAAEADRPDRL